MEIKVRIGKVEIEYSEPTKETDYPKCTARDKTPEIDGAGTKHDALLKTVREIAIEVGKLYELTC